MRNILKSIILSAILVCSCASQMQAQDREVIKQKVELRISTGECEKAKDNYKIFKELYGSDSELERKLAACGNKEQGTNTTTTSSNTPRKSYEPEMVYVQGGIFTMGCTSEQGNCDSDEKPAHQVTLSSYYIGKYEITQKQWQEVMGTNPSSFKGDNLPVETVSWEDVQAFISKLNQKTGKQYRLPTEAEWEYAAKGGNQSQGYKYSGSNTVGEVAWYDGNSDSRTHPAGTKKANELGIFDMSGNVWEWCSDWYGTYSPSPQTNPKGAASGSYRVFRGGSWDFSAQFVRVPYRFYSTPAYRLNDLGFRLASGSN